MFSKRASENQEKRKREWMVERKGEREENESAGRSRWPPSRKLVSCIRFSPSPLLPAGKVAHSVGPSSWAPADSKERGDGEAWWFYLAYSNRLMSFTLKPTFSFSLPPLLHLKSPLIHSFSPSFANNLLRLQTTWLVLIALKINSVLLHN